MSCNVMSCYAMLCHGMSHYTISYGVSVLYYLIKVYYIRYQPLVGADEFVPLSSSCSSGRATKIQDMALVYIDIITLDIACVARLGLCADDNTSLW